MLIMVWRRWVDRGQWWWLLVIGAVLILDVTIGSWLIAKEVQILKEVMSR